MFTLACFRSAIKRNIVRAGIAIVVLAGTNPSLPVLADNPRTCTGSGVQSSVASLPGHLAGRNDDRFQLSTGTFLQCLFPEA